MSRWCRVFGSTDAEPQPAALLEHLQKLGLSIRGHFHGDDRGWFRVELCLDENEPMQLERYLADEDGIRAELNTWAAWLETQDNPQSGPLMARMIATRQLFTVQPAETGQSAEVCEAVCRFLAQATGGVYQVDDAGFFAADGELLVRE